MNFFPLRGESTAAAKAVCAGCLCREDCLAYAMDDPTLVGIWAGTSFEQRKAMRKGPAAAAS